MTNLEVLNTVIKAKSLIDSLPQWPEEVKISAITDQVQVYKGIEALSVSAGAELFEVDSECEEYPVEKFFTYQGVKFFQIGKPEDFKNG